MIRRVCRIGSVVLPLLLSGAAVRATPLDFDLGAFGAPAALDTHKPQVCTVAYLVENVATNEVFAARMRFTPAADTVAVNGRMPCPSRISARVAEAALDGCREHADHKTDCVFADMSRGFAEAPAVANTSENASRCGSDLASHIAMACWSAGGFDVCSVACGTSREAAVSAARSRCEAKHQKACGITGDLPVQSP